MALLADFRAFEERRERSEKPVERRYQVLALDMERFLHIFIPDAPNVWFRCYEGLPEGSRILAVDYDPIARRLRMLVEHESFLPLPEGAVAPYADASFMSLTTADRE